MWFVWASFTSDGSLEAVFCLSLFCCVSDVLADESRNKEGLQPSLNAVSSVLPALTHALQQIHLCMTVEYHIT
jgi:hypothetical protein